MSTRPEIPHHIQTALTVLLNYLYAEEQAHFEEEQTVSHIFTSLRAVAEWIGYEPR
jgi:hypothetical protein